MQNRDFWFTDRDAGTEPINRDCFG